MKNKGLYFLVLAAFCFTNILGLVPFASAQSVRVLGEIRAEGKVLTLSSDGKWVPLSSGYPLLQSTSIKTADGVASIYFRDGSRISLSKDTAAVVGGTSGDYSVSLSKGVMAFNISPSSILSVTTSSGSVTTRPVNNIVQKVSYEEAGRVLGIISAGDKGTEVRSISGRLQVNINSSNARLVASGESILLGTDSGGHMVYKTLAVQPDTGKSDDSSAARLAGPAVILALFIGGAVCAFECPGDGLASPSR